MIQLTRAEINVHDVLARVSSAASGATVLFLGTTRQWTASDGEMIETEYLEYEGYEEMAVQEMSTLANVARAKWNITEIAMVHRLGRVNIQEASVAIAVSSAHRAQAFEAGQWLIDELKKQVPIWKREFLVGQKDQWQHPGVPRESCCQPLIPRPQE